MKVVRENAFFLALLCAFLGGLTPVAAKVALETIPPFTLIFLRFFFATLFLLPFVIQRKDLSWLKFRQLFGTGLVGALNPVLFFIALPFTLASVAPLIYGCVPALTALYLFMSTGQRITPKQVLGILIGLVGVGIVILTPLLDQEIPISAFTSNILIFVAAIAFMFYGILSKRYQSEHKVSPLALTFYFCLVTLVTIVPFSVFELATISGGLGEIVSNTGARQILGALATGILGSGLFYLMYQWAIAAGSEVAANLFTYLQPVFTILLAVVFLGESIGPAFVVGGVLAIVGARIARG